MEATKTSTRPGVCVLLVSECRVVHIRRRLRPASFDGMG